MPTRYLLINPNSSPHITARLAVSARAALLPDETLVAVNASGEPAVVHDAATLAIADEHARTLFETHAKSADAVLLGISLDGVVELLRSRSSMLPIVGMTEAALMSACLRANRVGVLTLGRALLPLYQDRIAQIGLAGRVAGIEAPEALTAFLPTTTGVDANTLDVIAKAGAQLQAAGAGALVLAGAVLCGYAPALSARLAGIPVFDGMTCAVAQARGILACTT